MLAFHRFPRLPSPLPPRALLQVAVALALLISSVDMPLHLLAQPTEALPGTEWRQIVSALSVPTHRTAYADASGTRAEYSADDGGAGPAGA